MTSALIVGAGPAGLMAAQRMAEAGFDVTICEAKPSPARKFLMAGKSGLNLTLDGSIDKLVGGYGARASLLTPALEAFDNVAIMAWAEDLGQPLFVGSTGRVFPKAMKSSPLLRAWLGHLESLNVTLRRRWRWTGWDDTGGLQFDTPEGAQILGADVVVLACGGASWARLGSDGAWADWMGVDCARFLPSNVGLNVAWSDHMEPHFGTPLKGIGLTAGAVTSRGEAVLTARGLEGGGVYTVSMAVRDGAPLSLDLLPDMALEDVVKRLKRKRGKATLSNHLRKSVKLGSEKVALLNEFARPLPEDMLSLAKMVKALPVPVNGLAPMDGAISTSGGVSFDALSSGLMLKDRPGVFCAGEMLDWEAPTGGWLLSACFATGAWAGDHAIRWVQR
ncbi:MAG: TIGR03862 family flavoprotein [Aliishimia sp.]